MKFYFNIILLTIFLGCSSSPYAEYPIVGFDDDKLSINDKIELIRHRTNQNDDGSLAASAKLYSQLGDYEIASAIIDRAIKLAPLNPSYHYQKASYDFHLNRISSAYNEAKSASELGYNNLKQDILYTHLSAYHADTSQFLIMVDSLNLKYTGVPELIFLNALGYLYKKDTVKALQYFSASVRHDSLSEEASAAYVRLLIQLDSIQLAFYEMDHLLDIAKTPLNYLPLQAEMMANSGETNKAIIAYTNIYKLSGETDAVKKLVKLYWQIKNYDSVIFYSRLAGTDPMNDRFALLNEARALDKKIDYREALNVYTMLYVKDTLDSLVGSELNYLQRKIAYLQRKREEEIKLADSLNRALPILSF